MRKLIIPLFALLGVSAQVAAEPAPVNITPCDTEVCAQKFKEFKKLARYGSPEAQIVMAGMLYIGYGTEKDVEKSLKMYRKAARRGSTFAAYRTGLLFLYEKDIEQDIEKGLEWLGRAGEKGYADASYRMADIYIQGKLVKQDLAEAEKWLLIGDENEDPNSQFRLGLIYEGGFLGEKKTEQAIELYTKAAKKSNRQAYQRLALLGALEGKEDIFAGMDNDDIERITVSGPELVDMLDLSLTTIKDTGLYSRRQTCSRIPGAQCDNVSSITDRDEIDNMMNGR